MSARGWFEQLGWDLRSAFRRIKAEKAFTGLIVLTLALGIGANTAIFSVINSVMLRELPVRTPAELFELLSRYPGEPRVNGFSWRVYEHYRDHNHVFSYLTGVSPARLRLSTDGPDVEVVNAEYVVGDFFAALGMSPAAGQLIGLEHNRLGTPEVAVAVLSWPYWQRRFAGDPTVVGRRIVIQNVPATVIGVAARPFTGLQPGATPDLWVPAAMAPLNERRRADEVAGLDRLGMKLLGRLKHGVSIEQARAEMSVLDAWRVEEISKTSRDPLVRQLKLELEPAATGFSALRDHVAKPLFILMTVATLTLLVAGINVATMLLARGASREREAAVRVSLGASRSRLVQQNLTDALLVSAAAGLLGLVLGYLGASVLVRIFTSGRPLVGLPEHLEIGVAPDLHVVLFTVGVAVLTGALFGLVPAWRSFVSAPASVLRHGSETTQARLLGNGLVVTQIALSVVLTSAAGVFLRHLSNLRSQDLGFRRDSILLVTLNGEGGGYDAFQLSARFKDLLPRLQAIPGVRLATLSGTTPASGRAMARFVNVPGFQEAEGARRYVSVNELGPKYFETLGIPFIAGRDFEFQDSDRPRVAIINRAMARRYFGSSDPIGRSFTFDGEGQRPFEIVGVVGDTRDQDPHQDAPSAVYLNAFQEGRIGMEFLLRTTVPPTAVVADVRRTVREVLKTVRIANVTTLAEQIDASIVAERLLAALSALLGVLGTALVGSGLYGLLAYRVARRVKEVGVRMALGATRSQITTMVLKGALRLASVGLLVGVPLALAARRVAGRLLLGSSAESPLPILLGAAAIVGVVVLAACVPARHAAGVNPSEALRTE